MSENETTEEVAVETVVEETPAIEEWNEEAREEALDEIIE